ncbi:DNA-3-methyladenine glycosylase I [Clostridiaceae bacterium OttesenSCG-928-D20]|nr:DNA-3-methyladenine glycosylase I [Clostridiaceae bacterium OttesenSCG-928-D20]
MDKKKCRCGWAGEDELYCKYHDEEWGKPLHDERRLFEMLCLEGAQAGLSWITILRKRENYRKAFDNFDIEEILKYDEKKIAELLEDSGIIRNRLKIRSVITNAEAFRAVQKEFGSFDKFIWGYVDNKPTKNRFQSLEEVPACTELSDRISKDLKKRGFKFIGSTIVYAYMQSIGMVNDHVSGCFLYEE